MALGVTPRAGGEITHFVSFAKCVLSALLCFTSCSGLLASRLACSERALPLVAMISALECRKAFADSKQLHVPQLH